VSEREREALFFIGSTVEVEVGEANEPFALRDARTEEVLFPKNKKKSEKKRNLF
jgi:hypothetical protein